MAALFPDVLANNIFFLTVAENATSYIRDQCCHLVTPTSSNVDQAHLILASGKLVLQKQPEVKAWNILATDARTSDGKLLVPLKQKQDSILV